MDSNGNPYYAFLSTGGQKLLSILTQKAELPPYVDSRINEELNLMAEEDDFLTEIRLAIVDLLPEQEDLGNDDDNDGINNTMNPHPEQLIIAPRYQALSPAGQKLLAILTKKSELLPTHVESRINEKLNAMAGDVLTEIRRALVDLLCEEEDFGEDDNEEMMHQRRRQQQQKNTFIKTIVDTKEWCVIEKQYEKAIRFFPDTLREMRHGLYPIQYISYTFSKEDENGDCTPSVYNLHLVSLIPLLAKLGIELQQFDDDMRGGLLMADPDRAGAVPLQNTISYWRNINANTQLLDDCFFSVLEKLRAQDLFRIKDIHQFNLIEGEFFSGLNSNNNHHSSGAFTVRNFRYLVEWDPTVLAVPIERDLGDWLPVHFCANNVNRTMEELSVVLQLGLQYYPEKFGHFFTERHQTWRTRHYRGPDDNNDDNINEEEIEDEVPLPDDDNDDNNNNEEKIEDEVLVSDDDNIDSDNEAEVEVEVPVPDDENDDSDNEEEVERVKGTPFEFACEVHGQPKVLEMVLKCVANYFGTSSPVTNTTAITFNLNADSSSGTTTAHDTESSLLLSAATDASIHPDGLYILLRKNPVDTYLKLHHHVSSRPHHKNDHVLFAGYFFYVIVVLYSIIDLYCFHNRKA